MRARGKAGNLLLLSTCLALLCASMPAAQLQQRSVNDSSSRASNRSRRTLAHTTPDGKTVLLTPPARLPPTTVQPAAAFVARRGHQLVLRGQPFYFVGFNAFWFIDSASWGGNEGRIQVAETMAAGQRLGMRVARTWAFNSRMPSGPNQYDEEQFLALDFIVYCARLYDLKLILALGNFWNAYKAPEEFLWYAMGPGGRTILDFYSVPAVRNLYKSHITAILKRVNRFTGVAYRDDPTIMGYDVLNEPRCPGCESEELQSVVVDWMREMTSFTKTMAPKQLAALGTEGFFISDSDTGLHLLNPGPGAQCEGENWPRIGNLSAVDFNTLHLYERHLEKQPVPPVGRSYLRNPDWVRCGFRCYMNWLVRYIQAHLEVSASTGGHKPIIIEEYGLTWWEKDVKDRKVLLAVVHRLLADSAANNGSLAGVMLWNGAHNSTSDQDGYNVKLDLWPQPLQVPPPVLKPLPPIMPYLAEWMNSTRDAAATVDDEEPETTLLQGQPEAAAAADVGGARRLAWQADKLDGFRRGWDRGACAHESSRAWRPPVAFMDSIRDDEDMAKLGPETLRWMTISDLDEWRGYAWPLNEVDIIKWGGDQVNRN